VGGSLEKELTLSIARRLRDELEARSFEVRVLLTRTSDRLVLMRDRIGLANSNDASLFISLHTNGGPIPSLEGFEVWYHNEGLCEEARRLGELIREELRGILHDRGTREGVLLLKGLRMPGLLVEIGFITNPLEEMRLKNPAFRRRITHALSKAILRYLEERG
jgi:N-acetylmuramoyl-L-alanine amidase